MLVKKGNNKMMINNKRMIVKVNYLTKILINKNFIQFNNN